MFSDNNMISVETSFLQYDKNVGDRWQYYVLIIVLLLLSIIFSDEYMTSV